MGPPADTRGRNYGKTLWPEGGGQGEQEEVKQTGGGASEEWEGGGQGGQEEVKQTSMGLGYWAVREGEGQGEKRKVPTI